MGASFKFFGNEFAERLLATTANPCSSITTSLVVPLVYVGTTFFLAPLALIYFAG